MSKPEIKKEHIKNADSEEVDIFNALAPYADFSLFGLGGMPLKVRELYKEYGLVADRANGHKLAMALAKKYVKGFQPVKTRGPKKKWDDRIALEFYMLVQIHKLKHKCSIHQSIRSVAKDSRFPKVATESQKTRYYERLKNVPILKEWHSAIENTKLRDKHLLGVLEETYSENF